MPSYKVILKDKTELRITAEDVELNADDHEPPWFNFYKVEKEDRWITLAAIPYDQVSYIIS